MRQKILLIIFLLLAVALAMVYFWRQEFEMPVAFSRQFPFVSLVGKEPVTPESAISNVEAEVEVESETQAEAETETQADAETETQAEAETETQADAEVEAETETQADAEDKAGEESSEVAGVPPPDQSLQPKSPAYLAKEKEVEALLQQIKSIDIKHRQLMQKSPRKYPLFDQDVNLSAEEVASRRKKHAADQLAHKKAVAASSAELRSKNLELKRKRRELRGL